MGLIVIIIKHMHKNFPINIPNSQPPSHDNSAYMRLYQEAVTQPQMPIVGIPPMTAPVPPHINVPMIPTTNITVTPIINENYENYNSHKNHTESAPREHSRYSEKDHNNSHHRSRHSEKDTRGKIYDVESSKTSKYENSRHSDKDHIRSQHSRLSDKDHIRSQHREHSRHSRNSKHSKHSRKSDNSRYSNQSRRSDHSRHSEKETMTSNIKETVKDTKNTKVHERSQRPPTRNSEKERPRPSVNKDHQRLSERERPLQSILKQTDYKQPELSTVNTTPIMVPVNTETRPENTEGRPRANSRETANSTTSTVIPITETFQQQVINFILLDDKIKQVEEKLKKYNQMKRELTQKKETYERDILSQMEKIDLDEINTETGKISRFISKRKVPMNKEYIYQTINKFINNPKISEEITFNIQKKRPEIKQLKIKRSKKRAQTTK